MTMQPTVDLLEAPCQATSGASGFTAFLNQRFCTRGLSIREGQ